MSMEKRNIIEDGRTPRMEEQDRLDEAEKTASLMFRIVPIPGTEKLGMNRGGDRFDTPVQPTRGS